MFQFMRGGSHLRQAIFPYFFLGKVERTVFIELSGPVLASWSARYVYVERTGELAT